MTGFTYADGEESLPSNFICAVCHDVCVTHSACPSCSQSFCQGCLHKWFDTQRTTGSPCTCPYCRCPLRYSELVHDAGIQAQLDALHVLCPNASAGCPAVMPRADLPAHLQHDCMQQSVSCRFCSLSGARWHIQQHEGSRCPKRLVACSNAAEGCEAVVPLDGMLGHLELNCMHACKPCAHCGEQVPRSSWLQHLQDSCPAQLPCPLRLYGCSFVGDTHAALSAHAGSCPYQAQKQALRAELSHGSKQGALYSATATATAAGDTDPGELPTGAFPDVLAAFGAPTTRSSTCLVRQHLLDSFPHEALPPKLLPAQLAVALQDGEQQDGSQHSSSQAAPSTSGLLLQRLAAGTVGPQQLSCISPPIVFDAAAFTATGAAGASTAISSSSTSNSGGGGQASSNAAGSSTFTCAGGVSPVEALLLGLPGCFAGVGLQSDPLLESAWRIVLNMAVVQVFKAQEDAAQQELSTCMLYASICRAWDTLLDFKHALLTAAQDSTGGPMVADQQQQGEMQQQQQEEDVEEEQEEGDEGQGSPAQQQPQQQQQHQDAASSSNRAAAPAAAAHAAAGGGTTRGGWGGASVFARRFGALLGASLGMGSSSSSSSSGVQQQQPPVASQHTSPQHQRQQSPQSLSPLQQQQQAQSSRQQLVTGQQLWMSWMGAAGSNGDDNANDHQQQQQQQQQQQRQSGRRQHDGGSSGSDDDDGSDDSQRYLSDLNDGVPGLQRGLYEDEFDALSRWLTKQEAGVCLLSAAAAVVYPVLCLWLSVGGPFFSPSAAEGAELQQVVQFASGRLGRLMVKLSRRAEKLDRKAQRREEKRQRKEEAEAAAAEAAAAAAGAAAGRAAAAAAGRQVVQWVQGLHSSGQLPVRGSASRGGSNNNSSSGGGGSTGGGSDGQWRSAADMLSASVAAASAVGGASSSSNSTGGADGGSSSSGTGGALTQSLRNLGLESASAAAAPEAAATTAQLAAAIAAGRPARDKAVVEEMLRTLRELQQGRTVSELMREKMLSQQMTSAQHSVGEAEAQHDVLAAAAGGSAQLPARGSASRGGSSGTGGGGLHDQLANAADMLSASVAAASAVGGTTSSSSSTGALAQPIRSVGSATNVAEAAAVLGRAVDIYSSALCVKQAQPHSLSAAADALASEARELVRYLNRDLLPRLTGASEPETAAADLRAAVQKVQELEQRVRGLAFGGSEAPPEAAAAAVAAQAAAAGAHTLQDAYQQMQGVLGRLNNYLASTAAAELPADTAVQRAVDHIRQTLAAQQQQQQQQDVPSIDTAAVEAAQPLAAKAAWVTLQQVQQEVLKLLLSTDTAADAVSAAEAAAAAAETSAHRIAAGTQTLQELALGMRSLPCSAEVRHVLEAAAATSARASELSMQEVGQQMQACLLAESAVASAAGAGGGDGWAESDEAAYRAAVATMLPWAMAAPGVPHATAMQRLLAATTLPGFVVRDPSSSSSSSSRRRSRNRMPRWMWGVKPLVAAELSSAILLLHDVRADQCELSLIPNVNTHVTHGYRAYWALSVLAGVQAWLGPGFRLSWQAVAVVNDMLVALVDRLTQLLGSSFYDAAQERVPMSPSLALEAARLVLPPGLYQEGLPRLLSLSTSYRDVSCENLREVTWEQLSRKLGLVAELDKMVSLVNELLPVTIEGETEEADEEDEEEEFETEGTYGESESNSAFDSGGRTDDYAEEEDEYEDEEEDSYETTENAVSGSGSGSSSSGSYTTDDGGSDEEGVEEQQAEVEQPQQQQQQSGWRSRHPNPFARQAGSATAGTTALTATGAGVAAAAAAAGGSAGSDSEWESASEEEEAAALALTLLRQEGECQQIDAAQQPGGGQQSSDQATTATPAAATEGGDGAAPADAAAAAAAGGSSSGSQQQQQPQAGAAADEGSSSSSDWQLQWSQYLAQLSQSAAAAASGSASAGGSAAAAGEGGHTTQALTPYTAQLLASAVGVMSHHPEQLMLHGTLSGDASGGAGGGGGAAAAADGGGVGASRRRDSRTEAALYLMSGVVSDATTQQHEQQRRAIAIADAVAAAAEEEGAAAAAGDGDGHSQQQPHSMQFPEQRPSAATDSAAHTRRQQQQQADDGEPEDACTHGVVLLVGVIEVVLSRLLQAAAVQAAADAGGMRVSATATEGGVAAAAAAGTSSSSTAAAATADGVAKACAGGFVLLQRGEPRVVVTPKHIQLAVSGDEDLAALLLQTRPGRPLNNTVGWSGGLSLGEARLQMADVQQLLNDPTADPITTFLLHLSNGAWNPQQLEAAAEVPSMQQQQQQQREQQQQHGGSSCTSAQDHTPSPPPLIVHPADLCVYCGGAFEAPPRAAIVRGDGGSDDQHCYDLEGPYVPCCFMSGFQCSGCAAQTAALAAAGGFEGQMQAVEKGLQWVLQEGRSARQQNEQQWEQQEGRGSGDRGSEDGADGGEEEDELLPAAALELSKEQLQRLLHATRMFHLQQPCWWDNGGSDGEGSGGGSNRGGSGSAAQQTLPTPSQRHHQQRLQQQRLPQQQQEQQPEQGRDDVDKAQLQQLHSLLLPLRDIVALREVCVQGQQASTVLPQDCFEQMVQDVLCDVLTQRRRQQRVQQQLRRQLASGAARHHNATRDSSSSSSGSAGGSASAGVTGGTEAVTQAPSSTAATASAAADSEEESAAEDDEESRLTLSPDALQLLQQAAEDFLTQQFSGANRLAQSYAGRQAVGPQDLAMALLTSGYGHMLPPQAATADLGSVGGSRGGGRSGGSALGRGRPGSRGSGVGARRSGG